MPPPEEAQKPKPKFTRKRLTKLADEGRQLFQLESTLQKSTAIFHLMALAGGVYLILPGLAGGGAGTLKETVILGVLIAFLVLGYVQNLVMIRLRKKWMELEKQSTYDVLTNAFNRRCFEEILDEEMARARRYNFPLSLCVIDLDDFKTFNDTYGHPRGDVLGIRSTDCLARYGGDEFCILLPHTDMMSAEKFIARLLGEVQEWLDCTFSAGVTAFRPGETKATYLARADLALYQAKKEGKNRIRCMIGEDDNQVVLSI
jgi:diguanylate cyclase (GGDEF)-like protein